MMSMVRVNHIERKVSNRLGFRRFNRDLDSMLTALIIKAIEEGK